MASISITLADTTTTYELPAEAGSVYSIGRAADCSLSLPDAEGLAEHHCSITCMEDGYAIADTGSETGTFSNGNKLENEYMADGVEYRLGSVQMRFNSGIVRKKVVKKAPAATNAAARVRAAAATAAYNQKQQQVNYFYVVLVLLGAFYAGMALYSWQHAGNPLPIFLR